MYGSQALKKLPYSFSATLSVAKQLMLLGGCAKLARAQRNVFCSTYSDSFSLSQIDSSYAGGIAVRTTRRGSSLVKLIKKAQRQETEAPDPSTSNTKNKTTNRWSSAVRGWIREFESSQRTEPLPAFDSLFKDARTYEDLVGS